MKTQRILIDLESLMERPGVLAFAGRPIGEDFRAKLDMNAKDRDALSYEIRIPEGTNSFTPSFFLGMFDQSVVTLGAAGFRKKYKFSGEPFDNIISRGIAEALLARPAAA